MFCGELGNEGAGATTGIEDAVAALESVPEQACQRREKDVPVTEVASARYQFFAMRRQLVPLGRQSGAGLSAYPFRAMLSHWHRS